MIHCVKCGQEQQVGEFGSRADTGKRKGVCKTCERNYRLDSYQLNKEKVKRAAREYFAENKEKRKAYLATRKEIDKRWNRNYKLQKTYGITLDAVFDTIEAQRCHCPICGSYYGMTDRRWHVDHCHTTGKVRGVICSNCNTMLGHAKDNPVTLLRAAAYLKGNQ